MQKEVSASVRQFAAIACRNLANTTQPFSGNDKETSRTGRWQGEFAVESDISKVFYIPTVDGGFAKALETRAEATLRKRHKNSATVSKRLSKFKQRVNGYISGGNMSALRKISNDMGWSNVRTKIDPAIHEAARTGPRKKVRKPAGGMTPILNKPSHLAAYVKKRQKLVGLTKAGWAKCADLIRTDKKTAATRGIPQWVTRNKAKSSGSVQDLSRDDRNPRVVMTNKIPWASNAITPTEARKAVSLAKRNFVAYMEHTVKAELRRRAKVKGN
jgi:hypothetical protein